MAPFMHDLDTAASPALPARFLPHHHRRLISADTPAAATAAPASSTEPCQHCVDVFTTSQQSISTDDRFGSPWALLCSPGLVYSRRRGSLEESARQRCGLCRVLLDSVVTGEKRRSNLKKSWDANAVALGGDQGVGGGGVGANRKSADDVVVHFEFSFETEGGSGPGSPVVRDHQRFPSWPGWGGVVDGEVQGQASQQAPLVPVLRVRRLGTLFPGTLLFDVATEHGECCSVGFGVRYRVNEEKGDPLAEPQQAVEDDDAFSLPVCSLDADRGTPEELATVKSWLDWCDNGHRSCVRKRRALPSRVLDVGEAAGVVRLVDSEGIEPEPYATLSYCWGGSQSIVTSTETIGEHMAGIEVAELPQTLQDAVKTTRALGLKYLWVDSLCIMQDSADDKEHEMARMQQVFQNSHVTIVAARARSCHEGFFHAERSRDPLVKLPVRTSGDQVGNMLLLPRKQPLVEQPAREPLHERAWALQEIVLSPRLLIYGRELTVWRCTAGEKARDCSSSRHHRHNNNSNNPLDWNGYCAAAGLTTIRLSPKGRIHQPRLSTHSPHSMFAQQSERLPRLFRTWKYVVHDYTARLLSDPMDKLPALSGIATYFRDAMEDQYLAGLWRKHLLSELSWVVSTSTTSSSSSPLPLLENSNSNNNSNNDDILPFFPASAPLTPIARRPPRYRAPSWSWMSVDAAIAFHADSCSWYEPVADVIACTVQPARPDAAPCGAVVGGALTLHGFMRPNVPSLLSPRTPFAVATAGMPGEEMIQGAYGTIYLDVPPQPMSMDGDEDDGRFGLGSGLGLSPPSLSSSSRRSSQGVYWCLLLARCFTRTPAEDDVMVDIETAWGLALALNGEEFERVGYFVGSPTCRTWFESGGKRDVTIV